MSKMKNLATSNTTVKGTNGKGLKVLRTGNQGTTRYSKVTRNGN